MVKRRVIDVLLSHQWSFVVYEANQTSRRPDKSLVGPHESVNDAPMQAHIHDYLLHL